MIGVAGLIKIWSMAVHTCCGSTHIPICVAALAIYRRMCTGEWEVGAVVIEGTIGTTSGVTNEARFAVVIVARYAIVFSVSL